MLQATRDIRKVALWLGHANISTTEAYLRVDPTEKLEAVEAVPPPALRRGRFKAPDALIAALLIPGGPISTGRSSTPVQYVDADGFGRGGVQGNHVVPHYLAAVLRHHGADLLREIEHAAPVQESR